MLDSGHGWLYRPLLGHFLALQWVSECSGEGRGFISCWVLYITVVHDAICYRQCIKDAPMMHPLPSSFRGHTIGHYIQTKVPVFLFTITHLNYFASYIPRTFVAYTLSFPTKTLIAVDLQCRRKLYFDEVCLTSKHTDVPWRISS